MPPADRATGSGPASLGCGSATALPRRSYLDEIDLPDSAKCAISAGQRGPEVKGCCGDRRIRELQAVGPAKHCGRCRQVVIERNREERARETQQAICFGSGDTGKGEQLCDRNAGHAQQAPFLPPASAGIDYHPFGIQVSDQNICVEGRASPSGGELLHALFPLSANLPLVAERVNAPALQHPGCVLPDLGYGPAGHGYLR